MPKWITIKDFIAVANLEISQEIENLELLSFAYINFFRNLHDILILYKNQIKIPFYIITDILLIDCNYVCDKMGWKHEVICYCFK